MDETPMLDAALSYARRGLAVIPLMEGDKVPAVAGGSNSGTCTERIIMNAWGTRPNMNVGIVCGTDSGGLVAIDLDVDNDEGKDGISTLREWEREHGELPKTAIVLTGGGGEHLLYRTSETVRNSVNRDAGVDIRSTGGYIVAPPSIHPNGREYEWEEHLIDTPIADADANVLAFIDSVQKGAASDGNAHFEMPEKVGKGERNDTIYKLGCSLWAKGFTRPLLEATLHTANERSCDPPLDDSEIKKTIESICSKPQGYSEEVKGQIADKRRATVETRDGTKTFNGFARMLIEKNHACFVDGAPAIWDGSKYATGWSAIDAEILNYEDGCKTTKRKEIREYIGIKAPRISASPPTLIAFQNGVFDVEAWELMDYAPDMVITNIIPHECDLNTYDQATDEFLDRIACYNETVRANLEEIIGLCMYRSNDYDTAPILIGSGSNGKSTFIAALRAVLGDDNVSSLEPIVMGQRFQGARLVGKLANLGDDISNEFLRGDVLAVVKKIASGEWQYTDVKGAAGFEFKPYCTPLFSCNEFPALGDDSEGTLRRFFPIPFNACFKRTDSFYDPKIGDKVTTDTASRYLINLGLYGLNRIIIQHGLTPNEMSKELLNDIRVQNDNVLLWMDDEGLKTDDLVGRPIPECYREYEEWCSRANIRNIARRTTFTRRINSKLGLKSAPRWHDFSDGKKQAKTFVRE